MTSPRIVIAIGGYNDAQYLHESVPSVLGQSVQDFALLLFDNGSTDESPTLMRAYSDEDPRVTFLRSPVNLWPPLATNHCWPMMMRQFGDTKWFLAHGADDVMLDGYLQAILDAADDDPGANCIFSPRQWLDHPEKGIKPWPPYNPATIHAEPQIPAWRAITRELWEQVGEENTSIRIGSDWEWAVRASVQGVLRPVQLSQPFLSLRVRPLSRVSQSDEVNWPSLHRHLCALVNQPVPAWATR